MTFLPFHHAAVLNILCTCMLHVLSQYFEFPILVNEYFSLGSSLVFRCNCIKCQHPILVILFIVKV